MAGTTVATWVKVKTKTGMTSRPISHKYEGGAGYSPGEVITQSEYEKLKAEGNKNREQSKSEKSETAIAGNAKAQNKNNIARSALPAIDPNKLQKRQGSYSGRKVIEWTRIDGEEMTTINVMQVSRNDKNKYFVTEPMPVKGKYIPLTDPLPLKDANALAKKLISGALPEATYLPDRGIIEFFPVEYVNKQLKS